MKLKSNSYRRFSPKQKCEENTDSFGMSIFIERFFGFSGRLLKQQDTFYSVCMYVFMYVCVYIYMPDGRIWAHFFPKTGRFRVHHKAVSGPTRVSHCENRHFRGQVWQEQERPKCHKLPTPWFKSSVLQNRNLNLCTGQLGANPL